ncbi:hypothetical protein [uncultured Shimia sp.]|nr:hypothetical protein [uncultured Shimia sp.]
MRLRQKDEFRQDAMRIALTSWTSDLAACGPIAAARPVNDNELTWSS